MKVAVIGAGLSGICTALCLARLGHETEVFERAPSVASEASFAGAGLLSPLPLNSLDAPASWAEQVTHFRARLRSRRDREARIEAQRLRQRQIKALTELGQEVRGGLRLDLDQTQGWLILLPDARSLTTIEPDLHGAAALGVAHAHLTASQARDIEPGLHAESAFDSALHLPDVTVLNPRQLAQQLRLTAEQAGAVFRLGVDVLKVQPGSPVTLTWASKTEPGDAQTRPFDAVVICTGHLSQSLVPATGSTLALRTLAGACLTVPLPHSEAFDDLGPRSAVSDIRLGVTMTRMGQRVRISQRLRHAPGTAKAASAATESLHKALAHWFPGVRSPQPAQFWQSGVSMGADGAPLLGAAGAAGVWLNLGHGHQGTALALGCAEWLAATMSGHTPEAEATALRPDRD
ncbi:NAD(P)/FAD-dependent oxidoreductase [Ideonella sp.]|uniref:NAD(P)/FAD-dependent oxidoreductase n=1 Tax=Ideonella sp. TaxID=1929293 RepID=UPI003BB6F3F4